MPRLTPNRIPDTQEAEIRRITVQSLPGQTARPYLGKSFTKIGVMK
jgi:hypothetical protein